MKLKIRKKDRVMVISGKDRGKIGEVIRIDPAKMRIVVGKTNMVARHKKPRGAAEPGGIHRMEAPIAYSNVMLMCPKCEKAIRPKMDHLATGEIIRLCRKCGEAIL
ncbi:MAG: 50S ribosomal protein L24 [Elusimicrobia bacterium]|nr:50S ribosomal protein L24 [Elusimicrobiota bacterium]